MLELFYRTLGSPWLIALVKVKFLTSVEVDDPATLTHAECMRALIRPLSSSSTT